MSAFVHEIQIKSLGFPGAPGFTNLYFETTVAADHDPQFNAAKVFLNQIAAAVFPSNWTGSVNAIGRILLADTGALGEFTNAPVGDTTPSPGEGPVGYGSGVSGAVISWSTATINRARLVRGRTFLVPCAKAVYDSDGRIAAGAVTALQAAAEQLRIADVGFCVWSRPRAGVGGATALVTGHRVSTSPAFLSSRRS